MGPPSPAIKMLIGPRASGCASARRPPGREQGRATQRRGIPFPAPTAGLAGCGSVIRGWLRPDCSPREQLPRKMNIPLLPRPGPLAQSGPVVPVASPPRAGSLTPTLVRLLGGGEGGSRASGGRLRGAELSSPGTPPHARPARPARRALPDAVRGRAVQPRTRSPRAATDARAPPLRTRSQLGRSGTLPGITPATLVPGDSGPRGDALPRAETRSTGGAGEGTMAAPGPNWGHMSPLAAIVRPGTLPHYRAPPLAAGPDVIGLQTRGGRPREGLSAWLRGLWGELQPRGRAENHRRSRISGARAWQPLSTSTPRVPRRRCSRYPPFGRETAWREASPAGTGSARVTLWRGDTAAPPSCASAGSAFSRAPPASPTRPAVPWPSHPRARRAGPGWVHPAFLPERSRVPGS